MTAARQSLSPMRRLAIFERAGGICHLCERKIQAGERWDVEHKRALALGGADDEANMAPAHVKCHAEKTRVDNVSWSKAKRVKAKHYGCFGPKRPRSFGRLPCGKDSKWKRKVSGETVLR